MKFRDPQMIVGNTRTGKPIRFVRFGTTSDPSSANSLIFYEPEDYFDCHAVFAYLAIREKRKLGQTLHFIDLENLMQFHSKMMGRTAFESQRVKLRILTSIDLVNHGRSLARAEFIDM